MTPMGHLDVVRACSDVVHVCSDVVHACSDVVRRSAEYFVKIIHFFRISENKTKKKPYSPIFIFSVPH